MTDLGLLVLKRNAFKTFSKDADNGLGHAYLFISEDGLVREEFLKLAAMRIFCKNICEKCMTCITIDEGSYADVRYFDGAQMKVKNVTDLTENASIRPTVGDKKVYLIDNADKLSAQAQNKLLKTYEEPPEYVTVILAASGENGILPTIKSRAKKLFFDALTAKETTELLIKGGAERAEAEIAAALADGNSERAEKFLSDEVNAELYDKSIELLLNLNASSQIAEYINAKLFSKDNILMTLDFLEIIIADIIRISACGENADLRNVGRAYDVKEIARKFTSQSAAMALYAVNEGRKKLSANVNATTTAESVMFDILEARYKWQA